MPEYERWIDPSEILVARGGEGIVYRDAVWGRRLHLHYSGFQLASVLAGGAPAPPGRSCGQFSQSFSAQPSAGYDPGLQVGLVCLRRESWVVGQDFWDGLPRERTSIRFAACLRELVQDRLAPVDLWYYQSRQGLPGRRKPRFLDLRSPLSACPHSSGKCGTGPRGDRLSVAHAAGPGPPPSSRWISRGQEDVEA